MSNLSDKLQQIETLRQEIESRGKLPDEVLRKVEYKFRLECNYHSNRIEGGTLTKPETRSIMVGNITVKGKPLKDIREMKGHDEVMLQILRVGRGELRLSPTRVREMHRAVIVEEEPEKQGQIGEWKKENNHIINHRLERFDFVPYDEVPESMQNLLNWLNAGLDKIKSGKKDAPAPLLLAFEFHLRYLTIHPFLDGNGRTARLLTNLLLVSCGYPPFWVSEGGEKDIYNRYLADVQAYGGDPDLLYDFLAGLVLRSLYLTADAIEGKDIEGDEDWLKKLQLLKSSLSAEDQVKLSRTVEAVSDIFTHSILPCIEQVMDKLSAYDDLFLNKKLYFGDENVISEVNTKDDVARMIIGRLSDLRSIAFSYQLQGFKKTSQTPFDISCRLLWRLQESDYAFYLSGYNDSPQFYRYYHQFYTQDDITEITKQCGQFMLSQIEKHIQRIQQ